LQHDVLRQLMIHTSVLQRLLEEANDLRKHELEFGTVGTSSIDSPARAIRSGVCVCLHSV
jgi:hypothetical protein